jgi:hypothetical protein
MHPVLKRILVNGGLTAAILAVIGFVFAELAAMWLASGEGVRPGSAGVVEPVEGTLRTRVPLTLAFWGFVFVAVGELILHRVRRNRPAAQPTEPQQDDAEKLLNELLAQAEAKAAAEAAARGQETGGSDR